MLFFKNGTEKGSIKVPVKYHCFEAKLMFKSTNIISMRSCNPIRSNFILINQTRSIEALSSCCPETLSKISEVIDIQYMAQHT